MSCKLGDNLHEMSKSIFWDKEEKHDQFVICWYAREVLKAN